MEKKNKTIKISELMKELQHWLDQEGDNEVVMVDEANTRFNGVGKSFLIKSATSDETFVGLAPGDEIFNVG